MHIKHTKAFHIFYLNNFKSVEQTYWNNKRDFFDNVKINDNINYLIDNVHLKNLIC